MQSHKHLISSITINFREWFVFRNVRVGIITGDLSVD